VIALRGYRATTVDGSGALISDEAVEYARSAPTARVVVGARRFEALSAALGASDADSWRDRAVVFLDDGFQHRQVARSLDIVLVDATRPALDGDVLPRGWLREPARNIARADIVVVTKAHATDARARAASLVARFRGRAHDAVCEHVWRSIDVVGEATSREVAWLAGKRVLSACALGNPAHFHGMVERATGVAPALLSRRDHVSFSVAELAASAQRAGVDVVVLSRKDIVKLDARTLSARGVTVVVPNLGLHFLEGEDRVRDAIARACDALRATVSAPGAPSSG
jgi:tetraacyldisaccharide 4'-kinase